MQRGVMKRHYDKRQKEGKSNHSALRTLRVYFNPSADSAISKEGKCFVEGRCFSHESVIVVISYFININN